MQGGIRDAPILDGGAGALSLYHYQGTSRVALLLDHCMRDTPTGKQLQICIEDLVLEIGMYGPLWNQRFNTYKRWISSHSWIYHVCSYNNDNEIKLSVDHTQLSPAREGDRAIMDAVSQCVDSASTLRAVNRVRMHHGVVHISDITLADGRKRRVLSKLRIRRETQRLLMAGVTSCHSLRLQCVAKNYGICILRRESNPSYTASYVDTLRRGTLVTTLGLVCQRGSFFSLPSSR